MPPVTLISKDGEEIVVPDTDAAVLLDRPDGKWRVRTDTDVASRLAEEAHEDTYGGVRGKIATAGANVLSGATLGLSDAYIRAAGGAEDLRGYNTENPTTAVVGNVVGAVATAVPSGGTSLLSKAPAAAAARLGARIAEVGEGAGALTRVGRAALGYGAEGAAQGIGAGVSELATSEDPLTLEHIASTLSSNMLYGGVVGAGAGTVAKTAEIGLGRTKRAIEEWRAGRQALEAVPEDLAVLDRKGLKAAEDAEVARIRAEKEPMRASIADEIKAHRGALKDEKIWLATSTSSEREMKEIGKVSLRADQQLDRLLDNPRALAEDPFKMRQAQQALQQQEHALERLAEVGAAAGDAPRVPKFAELGDEGVTTTVPARDLRDYGYRQPKAGSPLSPDRDPVRIANAQKAIAEGQREPIRVLVSPKGTLEVANGRHRLFAAIEADAPITVEWRQGVKQLDSKAKKYLASLDVIGGEGRGGLGATQREAIEKVPAAIERNRALQARIKELAAPPASERLAAIEEAKQALAAGKPHETIAEQMLKGAVFSGVTGGVASLTDDTPLGGIGAMVAPFLGARASRMLGEQVFGRLGKAVGEQALRASKAVERFVAVGQKVAKAAPPIATKILARARFAPAANDEQPAHGASLADLYKARSEELRRQTMYTPDGGIAMRPAARAELADRLTPIAAIDPVGADRLETLAARRVEFLASKLPRRPDIAGGPVGGPDRWQPSDMEMRTFAAYVTAVEDPIGVIERLSQGLITPEAAEAVRAVYPELHADLTRQITEQLPTLRTALPYQRRIALSVFTGVPVDPAMDPRILRVLQAQFLREEGTDGGVQAPRAQPQFGSVSKPEPTPAQERAS